MESDEEAISAAQENLDKLNVEKQQEGIQYQIEQLESLKSILENLDEEKQKEANKKALEEYFGGKNPLDLTNSDMVSKLVKGYAENRISINTGTGEIKDADGNVIGKIDGVEGVKDLKEEDYKNAETGLKEALKTFNTSYGPGVARNWGVKGSQEYTSNVDKYNKAYGDVEKALSAAKAVGIESGNDFEAAQNIIKGGKEKDVSYKRVDLSVKNMPGFRDREEGTVKLDPSLGTSGNPKDVYNYLNDNIVKKYNSTDGTWENWVSWKDKDKSADDVDNLPDYSIIGNGHLIDEFYFIYGGSLYPIRSMSGEDLHGGKDWATGTLSAPEGLSLINELGTEAVITPGGTLTALPSKTGIVPADITRNVWALGEVAPTLVAQLGSLTQKMPSGNAGNTTYEEGQYFDNFTMNVYPAKGDDFNKILEQARAQMRLTRHNN